MERGQKIGRPPFWTTDHRNMLPPPRLIVPSNMPASKFKCKLQELEALQTEHTLLKSERDRAVADMQSLADENIQMATDMARMKDDLRSFRALQVLLIMICTSVVLAVAVVMHTMHAMHTSGVTSMESAIDFIGTAYHRLSAHTRIPASVLQQILDTQSRHPSSPDPAITAT